MSLQELETSTSTHKRLMTRSDFVGMYRAAYSTLLRHIKSGDVELHLVGTIIYIEADEALAVMGNPPLRNAAPVVRGDLFT